MRRLGAIVVTTAAVMVASSSSLIENYSFDTLQDVPSAQPLSPIQFNHQPQRGRVQLMIAASQGVVTTTAKAEVSRLTCADATNALIINDVALSDVERIVQSLWFTPTPPTDMRCSDRAFRPPRVDLWLQTAKSPTSRVTCADLPPTSASIKFTSFYHHIKQIALQPGAASILSASDTLRVRDTGENVLSGLTLRVPGEETSCNQMNQQPRLRVQVSTTPEQDGNIQLRPSIQSFLTPFLSLNNQSGSRLIQVEGQSEYIRLALRSLTYTPPDGDGGDYDVIHFNLWTIRDDREEGPQSLHLPVVVTRTPVPPQVTWNEGPINTTLLLEMDEDSVLSLSKLSINIPFGVNMVVNATIAASHGQFDILPDDSFAHDIKVVTRQEFDASAIQMSGRMNHLNQFVKRLVYKPHYNYNGPDTIVISVTHSASNQDPSVMIQPSSQFLRVLLRPLNDGVRLEWTDTGSNITSLILSPTTTRHLPSLTIIDEEEDGVAVPFFAYQGYLRAEVETSTLDGVNLKHNALQSTRILRDSQEYWQLKFEGRASSLVYHLSNVDLVASRNGLSESFVIVRVFRVSDVEDFAPSEAEVRLRVTFEGGAAYYLQRLLPQRHIDVYEDESSDIGSFCALEAFDLLRDDEMVNVTISISVNFGKVSSNGTLGTSVSQGNLTFQSKSVENLRTVLTQLRYTPVHNFAGDDTLVLSMDDQAIALMIRVVPVNDPPCLVVGEAEDPPFQTFVPSIQVDDPDSSDWLTLVVTIGNNCSLEVANTRDMLTLGLQIEGIDPTSWGRGLPFTTKVLRVHGIPATINQVFSQASVIEIVPPDEERAENSTSLQICVSDEAYASNCSSRTVRLPSFASFIGSAREVLPVVSRYSVQVSAFVIPNKSAIAGEIVMSVRLSAQLGSFVTTKSEVTSSSCGSSNDRLYSNEAGGVRSITELRGTWECLCKLLERTNYQGPFSSSVTPIADDLLFELRYARRRLVTRSFMLQILPLKPRYRFNITLTNTTSTIENQTISTELPIWYWVRKRPTPLHQFVEVDIVQTEIEDTTIDTRASHDEHRLLSLNVSCSIECLLTYSLAAGSMVPGVDYSFSARQSSQFLQFYGTRRALSQLLSTIEIEAASVEIGEGYVDLELAEADNSNFKTAVAQIRVNFQFQSVEPLLEWRVVQSVYEGLDNVRIDGVGLVTEDHDPLRLVRVNIECESIAAVYVTINHTAVRIIDQPCGLLAEHNSIEIVKTVGAMNSILSSLQIQRYPSRDASESGEVVTIRFVVGDTSIDTIGTLSAEVQIQFRPTVADATSLAERLAAASNTTLAVDEDTPLTLDGILVLNSEHHQDNIYRLSASVSHGTLELPIDDICCIHLTTPSTSPHLEMEGTLQSLRDALSVVSYSPTTDYTGVDSLRLSISDNDNAGWDWFHETGINIRPVNDAPRVVIRPGQPQVLEYDNGTTVRLTDVSIHMTDVDISSLLTKRDESIKVENGYDPSVVHVQLAVISRSAYIEIPRWNSLVDALRNLSYVSAKPTDNAKRSDGLHLRSVTFDAPIETANALLLSILCFSPTKDTLEFRLEDDDADDVDENVFEVHVSDLGHGVSGWKTAETKERVVLGTPTKETSYGSMTLALPPYHASFDPSQRKLTISGLQLTAPCDVADDQVDLDLEKDDDLVYVTGVAAFRVGQEVQRIRLVGPDQVQIVTVLMETTGGVDPTSVGGTFDLHVMQPLTSQLKTVTVYAQAVAMRMDEVMGMANTGRGLGESMEAILINIMPPTNNAKLQIVKTVGATAVTWDIYTVLSPGGNLLPVPQPAATALTGGGLAAVSTSSRVLATSLGGFFKLRVDSEITHSLRTGASALEIQDALEELSAINAVQVTAVDEFEWDVTFFQPGTNVPLLQGDSSMLMPIATTSDAAFPVLTANGAQVKITRATEGVGQGTMYEIDIGGTHVTPVYRVTASHTVTTLSGGLFALSFQSASGVILAMTDPIAFDAVAMMSDEGVLTQEGGRVGSSVQYKLQQAIARLPMYHWSSANQVVVSRIVTPSPLSFSWTITFLNAPSDFPSLIASTNSAQPPQARLTVDVSLLTASNNIGGTFTLSYQGQITAPLPVSASAATVEAQLNLLDSVHNATAAFGRVLVRRKEIRSVGGASFAVLFVEQLFTPWDSKSPFVADGEALTGLGAFAQVKSQDKVWDDSIWGFPGLLSLPSYVPTPAWTRGVQSTFKPSDFALRGRVNDVGVWLPQFTYTFPSTWCCGYISIVIRAQRVTVSSDIFSIQTEEQSVPFQTPSVMVYTLSEHGFADDMVVTRGLQEDIDCVRLNIPTFARGILWLRVHLRVSNGTLALKSRGEAMGLQDLWLNGTAEAINRSLTQLQYGSIRLSLHELDFLSLDVWTATTNEIITSDEYLIRVQEPPFEPQIQLSNDIMLLASDDAPLAVNGISVVDANAAAGVASATRVPDAILDLRLDAALGRLFLLHTDGLGDASTGDNSTLTLRGTVSMLNGALSSLQYKSSREFSHIRDTITISVNYRPANRPQLQASRSLSVQIRQSIHVPRVQSGSSDAITLIAKEDNGFQFPKLTISTTTRDIRRSRQPRTAVVELRRTDLLAPPVTTLQSSSSDDDPRHRWLIDLPGFSSSLASGRSFAWLPSANGVRFVFTGIDRSYGEELWVSDGTSNGTELLVDLSPGNTSSRPSDFAVLPLANNRLIFAADGIDRSWALNSGQLCNRERLSSTANDILYVVAASVTWNPSISYDCPSRGWRWAMTDEVASRFRHTIPTVNLSEPYVFWSSCDWNGYVFGGVTRKHFRFADSSVTGALKHAGRRDSAPLEVSFSTADFAGIVCIRDDTYLYESLTGRELWITDGSTSVGSTQRLKDIDIGPRGSNPQFLTPYQSRWVIFQATTSDLGTELYKTDGTTSGTVLVEDIWRGPRSSNPSDFAEWIGDGRLYFAATTEAGRELWSTDGLSSVTVERGRRQPSNTVLLGTTIVRDICSTPTPQASSNPQFLTPLGSIGVFFAATDCINGRELWVTDGTFAGTKMVKDINPTSGQGSDPSHLVVFNGKLYFAATANAVSMGRELFVSDGTAVGTQLLVELVPGVASATPTLLTVANAKLYFHAFDSYGIGSLWVSDGTATGTSPVWDTPFAQSHVLTFSKTLPRATSSGLNDRLFAVNNALYYFTQKTATGARNGSDEEVHGDVFGLQISVTHGTISIPPERPIPSSVQSVNGTHRQLEDALQRILYHPPSNWNVLASPEDHVVQCNFTVTSLTAPTLMAEVTEVDVIVRSQIDPPVIIVPTAVLQATQWAPDYLSQQRLTCLPITVLEDVETPLEGFSVRGVDDFDGLATWELELMALRGTLNLPTDAGRCVRMVTYGKLQNTKHVGLTASHVTCLTRLLSGLTYTSDPNVSGADTLTIRVTVSISRSSTISADDIAIIPLVVTEVNDAPYMTSQSGFFYEANEDAALIIRDLRVVDPDAVAPTKRVRVDMQVRYGCLSLLAHGTQNSIVVEQNVSAGWALGSSTRLVLSGALTDVNAVLSAVAFTSARDWNSFAHADENDGYDVVSVELSDDLSFNASTHTNLFVFVLPTPDPVVIIRPQMHATSIYVPMGDTSVLHGDEDTWLDTTGLGFTSKDDTARASLDVMLRVSHGRLEMDKAALRSSGVTTSGSADDGSFWRLRGRFGLVNRSIAGLRYIATPDYYGEDTLEIVATATDDYTNQQSIQTSLLVPLYIHAVNDPPQWTFPSSRIAWKQDGSTRITGVQLGDVDAASVDCTQIDSGFSWEVVVQTTGSGMLMFPRLRETPQFTAAMAASRATNYVEMTGSLSDINIVLSEIVLTTADSDSLVREPVEVWFTADDQGLCGSGGSHVTRQRLVVSPIEWTSHSLELLTPQDDVLTVDEDTALVFEGSIQLRDREASTLSIPRSPQYEVTIESNHGQFLLAPSSIHSARLLVTSPTERVFQVRGYLPQINAALNGSSYVPDHDWFGSEQLRITAHQLMDAHDDADVTTTTLFLFVSPICDAPRWRLTSRADRQADLELDEDDQVLVTSLTIVDPDVLENEEEADVTFHRDVSVLVDVYDGGGIMLATTRGLRIDNAVAPTGWSPEFAQTRLLFFSSVVLTGRVGDLNAALRGLIFRPQPNFHTNGHVRDAISLRVFTSDDSCLQDDTNDSVTLRAQITAVNDAPLVDSPRFHQVPNGQDTVDFESTLEIVAGDDQVLDPITIVDVDMNLSEETPPNVRLRLSCRSCTVRPSMDLETLQQTYGVVALTDPNSITTTYYGSITTLNAVVLSSMILTSEIPGPATIVVVLEVSDLGFFGRGGPLETAFVMVVRVLRVNTGPEILVPPYNTHAPPLQVDEHGSILLQGAPPLPQAPTSDTGAPDQPTWQLLFIDPLGGDARSRVQSLMNVSSLDGRTAISSYALLSSTQLVFSAFNEATGVELWTSDGTASGTQLLKDLWPGVVSSNPRFLTHFSFDRRVYFAARAPNTNDWRLRRDLRDTCDGFRESVFARGVFFMVAQATTWFIDETYDCPMGYKWMSTAEAATVFVGTVPRDGHGHEPLVYYDQCGWDGYNWGGNRRSHFRFADSKTTGAFKDIGHRDSYRPDVGFQTQAFAGIVCRRLAPDELDDIPESLWSTDGTTEGTRRVTSVASRPAFLTEFRGQLFFQATSSGSGAELWATDGSTSGTQLIADVAEGPPSATPEQLTVANGQLFFSADSEIYGCELWISDGNIRTEYAQVDHGSVSAVATRLVLDIFTGASSSNPQFLTALPAANLLLFQADDGVHGIELWKSDGSASGTALVTDIRVGPRGSEPQFLTHFNGRVFFEADDGVHGPELWVTDGLSTGTQLLVDLVVGTRGSGPRYLSVLSLPAIGSVLVFAAATDRDPQVIELWTSDGTSSGTQKLFPGTREPLVLNDAAMKLPHDGRQRLLALANGVVVLGRQQPTPVRTSEAPVAVSRSLTLVDNDNDNGSYRLILETTWGELSLINRLSCGSSDMTEDDGHRIFLHGSLAQLNCLVAQVVYETTTPTSSLPFMDGWDDAIVVTLIEDPNDDDDGRAYATTQRVPIRVASLNHPPTIDLPTRILLPLDAWTTLPTIAIGDEDAGDDAKLLLRVAVQRGSVRLVEADRDDLILLSDMDPRGSGVLEVAGSLISLNHLVIQYACHRVDGCVDGDNDVIVVTVDDNGFSGRGGAMTTTQTMSVVVVGQ